MLTKRDKQLIQAAMRESGSSDMRIAFVVGAMGSIIAGLLVLYAEKRGLLY